MFLTYPNVTVSESTLHELACRALSGGAVDWPFSSAVELQSRFLQTTRRHGVQPLLYVRLRASESWELWPSELRDALRVEAASQAVVEMIQSQETIKVLEALSQNGVRPLLMKGAALAHTHYRSPHLRPRGDTDLLIRLSERDAASCVLAELGYVERNATSGELVSYQTSWDKLDRHDVTHVIDLHWRVSNCQLFAEALSFDELVKGSVPIPLLAARALGPVHALLIACMHRVGHVTVPWWGDETLQHGDRMIWLYDIHLLASRMSREELTEFARLAVTRRLKTISLDGLRQSQRLFGTSLPSDALAALSAAGPLEPSARYLEPGRLRYMVRDIRSLSTMGDRLRLANEHLFPPADYMLKRYAVSRRAWLPALYLRRGIQGMWRLLGFQRLLRLTSHERRALLAGGLAVATARILLWVLPFRRLLWLVQRTGRRTPRAVPVRFTEARNAEIVWGITTAARYVPRATCLTQALAAQWLFGWLGRPTLLRVGVARGEDRTLRVHAWLESEGQVVVGGEPLEQEEYMILPLQAAGAAKHRVPPQ